jgi:hypothetical protein
MVQDREKTGVPRTDTRARVLAGEVADLMTRDIL